jgi:catechol 2,3-dioxygenase-like lactoylglutathione lyase family enzyme
MSIKFAVISIWAEDEPACAHFYRDVLGLTLMPHPQGGRPHFTVDGVYLTILKGKPVPARSAQPSRFPIFAFSVDDLDAMIERLEKHHVALPWGVEGGAGERWVMFHDPAGNLIELAQFTD